MTAADAQCDETARKSQGFFANGKAEDTFLGAVAKLKTDVASGETKIQFINPANNRIVAEKTAWYEQGRWHCWLEARPAWIADIISDIAALKAFDAETGEIQAAMLSDEDKKVEVVYSADGKSVKAVYVKGKPIPSTHPVMGRSLDWLVRHRNWFDDRIREFSLDWRNN